MKSILAAGILATSLATTVEAYQWSQTAGGSYRSGVWPAFVNDPSEKIQEEGSSSSSATTSKLRHTSTTPGPSISESIQRAMKDSQSGILTARNRVPSLIYEIPKTTFMLQKSPAIVVSSSGNVVILTDECVLIALPSPDLPGAIWQSGSELWFSSQAFNQSAHSRCFDVVLDENDNIFHTVRLDNVDRAYLYGYNTNNMNGDSPVQLWNAVDMGGDMRLFALYAISLLYTKGEVWVPMNGENGVGLTIVKTATGASMDISMGPTGHAGVAGSCKIPNPAIGGDDFAVFTIAHEFDAKGPFLSAYDDAGRLHWSTNAQVFTDIDQPHPLLDPFTGKLYAIAFEGQGTDFKVAVYCFYKSTGSTCDYPFSDGGVEITDNFGGYTTLFVYAGAILIDDTTESVSRILYSFPLTISTNEPSGCIIAVSPTTGQVLDSFCVPRDPTSPLSSTEYMATAPLIALNARGAGLHTVYLGISDSTIVALDPTNLAGGVMYTAFPASVASQATMATDFLTMTSGGTLVYPVWEDDDNGVYGTIAIPNINSIPPTNGGGGASNNVPDPGGLSPGSAAAVSIVSLALVGALVAFPVYKTGSVSGALEKYAGVKGGLAGLGLGNFSIPTSVSKYLPGRGGYASVGGGGANSSTSLKGSGGGSSSYSSGGSGNTAYQGGTYTSSGGGYGSVASGGSSDPHSKSIFNSAATDL